MLRLQESVYKGNRNIRRRVGRVKSSRGKEQRKIYLVAAVSKSARNTAKCDSSKQNSFTAVFFGNKICNHRSEVYKTWNYTGPISISLVVLRSKTRQRGLHPDTVTLDF